MHRFKIEIQELARAGKHADAEALRRRALNQADRNEARYRSTIKLIGGEPWVYKVSTGPHKYPQKELMEPDFAYIRRELKEVAPDG
jgi:hypothetical protein